MRARNTSTIALAAAVAVAGCLSATASAAGGTPHAATQTTGRPANLTSPTGHYTNGTLLPDGRLLTPAGHTTPLGDFPTGIAIAPNGALAVVSNSGQGEGSPQQGNESLQLVNAHTGQVLQTLTDHLPGKDTFYNGGVTWSPDGGHVYASGGGNDAVYDYALSAGHLILAHTWSSTSTHATPTAGLGTPSGGIPGSAPVVGNVLGYSKALAITPEGHRLIVANEQGGSVAAIDTRTGMIAWQSSLGANQQLPGTYPSAVALSPDGRRAYVTAQGTNSVYTLDASTGAVMDTTAVGDHPVAVTVSPTGRQLYVADANDDSLAILSSTPSGARLEREMTTHLMSGEGTGSAPTAVTLDSTRHHVYVTNSGDNTIAAFGGDVVGGDLSPASVHQLGQMPTGFYPSALAVDPSGDILVTSAKGFGGVPVVSRQQYDGNDMVGTLARVATPDVGDLRAGTRTATADELFSYGASESQRPAGSPIPSWTHAGQSPIKHVVLVVRENRTFDQEFGDLASLGRTDARVEAAFTEFGLRDRQGRTITPNAHALADQFALSDNFFSNGEASIQGHHWTAEGTSTVYTENSWTQYYSARNHPYDPAGSIVYPRCGALFQQLAGAGKPFRNFGELTGLSTAQNPTLHVAPQTSCVTPGGVHDRQSIASASPSYPNNLTLTSVPDTTRLRDFQAEYAPLVAANRVPALSYVLMGNDHTDGTQPGKKTPQALVATNDEAVGGLVSYLSHTPQWASTLVLVEEDDSQDGLDHVDGHRNILMVAGPWAAHRRLSHLHASQASVTAIIDRVLGLAPLSQAAQYAPIPYDMFGSSPNLASYTSLTPSYPTDATNPSAAPGTASAVPVNTRGIDLAGPVLEAQIWQATHPGEAIPATLIDELGQRGGIRRDALRSWSTGRPCGCTPLLPGLTMAPGYGDADG
ncbi:bifunctional YncE family protein/alkaline phosphatase family protein [Terrabacter carboxydivorans]|uniref:Alkaline phosphatase family protein n=1 Tax=Terrabacter carboxydivorans TaxID=619730 RepID=A0ABP5ZPW4_9MICO